jgi:hypothetical protein
MYEPALWLIAGFLFIGLLSRIAIFLFTISLFFLITAMLLNDHDAVIGSGFCCILFGAISGGQRNVNVWN